MNIFQQSKKGIISPEVKAVSSFEEVPVASVMDSFSKGEIAIFKNRLRNIKPVAIGKGLRTKINANIGSSPDMFKIDIELEKLRTAIEYGADTVMDLSTGGNIREFRKRIIEESSIPLGTVPIYEVAVSMAGKRKSVIDMNIDDYLEVIKRQAEDGVDYMTIHSGVTMQSLESLHSQERIIGITSRGGSMLSHWITVNKKENPLYEYFDEILDILADYNIVISLGDGLRPGCISDAGDRGQVHEMIILGRTGTKGEERGECRQSLKGRGMYRLI